MAYAFTASDPIKLTGGVWQITIVETEAGITDEWDVDLSFLGSFAHVVLHQVEITGTGAATVQPALGESASWTIDGDGHVYQATLAVADATRLGEYKNVSLRDGSLYGRSTPNAEATEITTRLHIKAGAAL